MASNPPTPYIPKNPGDLITVKDWNNLQVDVKRDIGSQIQTAVGNIKNVDDATNSDQLGGQTPDQLTQTILKQAKEILLQRTGYLRSFNRLETGKEKILRHGLKGLPLVDVYQLDYFHAICSRAENDSTPVWVNFFLYHTSERTLSAKSAATNQTVKAVIEESDQQPFRVLFSDMLASYNVQYTNATSLEDLETDFWTVLWAAPNDEFDADQYCHSPWFEKCCSEQCSVKQLKDRGDWDDIWFKMVPRKTINFPTNPINDAAQPDPNAPFDGTVAPTQVQVAHHDFDTVGIKLLGDPIYPQPMGTQDGDPFTQPANTKELKVMVLLRV